ncbi:MAG: RNA 2',3'-cyclic phosphodiesterase [Candidatus Pacearchaeota archaeon]
MSEDKKLTRAFIAIEFSDEVIKEIIRVQELVSGIRFTGKLTEPENLHLTLKFLGEIDDDKLEKVREKVREIKFDVMRLKLGKLGTFSVSGKPRIIWIKVEGKALYDLQKKIDSNLKDMFKPEERFMGHLTIARVKYVKDKKSFMSHIKSIHVKPVAFDVGCFKLKKSELKAIGPIYSDIEVVKLNE